MTGFALTLLATALPLLALAAVIGGIAYASAHRGGAAAPGHARRVAVRGLLATYALALAWWTILLANPNHDGGRHANLTPFREIARSLTNPEPGYGLLNFWGNIVAFVPVGVLGLLAMRRARPRSWFMAIAGGTALSATLELIQYAVGRSADVDDVILNAVGVGLGVAIAVAARRAFSGAQRADSSVRRSSR